MLKILFLSYLRKRVSILNLFQTFQWIPDRAGNDKQRQKKPREQLFARLRCQVYEYDDVLLLQIVYVNPCSGTRHANCRNAKKRGQGGDQNQACPLHLH